MVHSFEIPFDYGEITWIEHSEAEVNSELVKSLSHIHPHFVYGTDYSSFIPWAETSFAELELELALDFGYFSPGWVTMRRPVQDVYTSI